MWLGWPNYGFRSDSSWEFVPSVETETTSNNPELPVPTKTQNHWYQIIGPIPERARHA